MMATRFMPKASLALGLAINMVPTVQAQNPVLEEVIVTAERREASLQETDISMTVMGAGSIEERGITDFTQIGDFAPNVTMQDIPTSAGGSIGIRGFRSDETIATFEPKVGLYLDGVLIAKNAGAAFDVLDLERIEILRGPQGTLYGRNTAGGAVNLVTKKPSDEFEAKLTGTVGKFSQRDIKATVNVPLVGPDGVLGRSSGSHLNLRANLASLNRDGYWDNKDTANPVDEAGNKNRDVAHVQLLWEPSEGRSFLYSFDKSNINESFPAAVLYDYNPAFHPELAPYVSDGGDDRNFDHPQKRTLNVEGHSLTVDWDLNESLSLVSISALRTSNDDSKQDSEGTPEFIFNTDAGNETETFTQEVRLVGTAMDTRLEYVAGAFYMDEDIKGIYSNNILPNLGYTFSGLNASGKNEVWAVFGETTYSLTDKLDLTLGLRYTKEDRQMSRYDTLYIPAIASIGPPYDGTPTILPKAGPKSFDDVSGTVGVQYQWTDDLMTYFKISKGYVSGGFNARAPSPATFGRGYDEETVYCYELGWKTTWLGNRLQVNGAVFYNDYQDLQVNLLDQETARNNLSNAGDAEISGLELEIEARPIANLELGGGYGYLDPTYKTYVDAASGEDLSNNRFAHAPNNSFNAYGRYVVPEFMSAGDLVFRLDYSWMDDFSILTARGNDVNGYHLINGRIALESVRGPGDTNLTVALWGKNLDDELYYTSGYNLNEILGFYGIFTGPPRSYGVDLTVEF